MLCGKPAGEKERDSGAEHGPGADGKGEFWEAKACFFHDNRFVVFLKSSNGGMVRPDKIVCFALIPGNAEAFELVYERLMKSVK